MILKLLVFDLDGTLVDTGDDLVNAVTHSLKAMGLPARSRQEVFSFVGDGVRKLMERSLGEHADRLEEGLSHFKSFYSEHLLDNTKLYPGVMETLRRFASPAKVVITNKTYEFSVIICRALGIAGCFREIVAGDSNAYLKPDARLLQPMFARYGAKPAETLVIGDGRNDILLARNAGARSCAVLNGIGRREELLALNPDFTVEAFSDLVRLGFES